MFIDIMEEGTYLPREITPRKKLLPSIIFFKTKIRNRGLAKRRLLNFEARRTFI